ncbi:MAG: DUF1289 domain-containing protein [Planctomycetes bacterium]|nr:DUF1289 domain-containing protein [Planctomycetota bacterium]
MTASPRHEPLSPPRSPCVLVCRMDERDRYCLGCQRTRAEIAAWFQLDDATKRSVLAELPARRATSPRPE